jgi:two-component system, chemotaxis family, protein-glutamate methylesterase/glutaminase
VVEAAGVISVLVVDDSALIRRLVTDALGEDPDIRVVGTAPNGRLALTKIDQLAPDLVTLDIEMPVLDGLETLRAIRRTRPRLPVIMFSTLTAAGATATLNALALGASDYVTKPNNTGGFAASRRSVQEQLVPRIHALCHRPVLARPTRPPVAAAADAPRSLRVDIVAVGCSTGGPDALTRVIAALPAAFPVPIVVVQHMPALFTRMFAQRLDRVAALTVVEAADGVPVQPGTVYVAPGDQHLEVARRGATIVTRLHSGPPENFCRPAVDVLFRSVAQLYGAGTLAVVLTGMGQDGRRGSELLHAAGAEIVAQDEATSVVWGMPGAVVGAGLTESVLPLDKVASHVVSRAAHGRAESKAVASWR